MPNQIIVLLLATTMLVLIICADLHQESTYHDVLRAMGGKKAQQLAALSIMSTCFGVDVTFLIIIGDQFDRCKLLISSISISNIYFISGSVLYFYWRRFLSNILVLTNIHDYLYRRNIDLAHVLLQTIRFSSISLVCIETNRTIHYYYYYSLY